MKMMNWLMNWKLLTWLVVAENHQVHLWIKEDKAVLEFIYKEENL